MSAMTSHMLEANVRLSIQHVHSLFCLNDRADTLSLVIMSESRPKLSPRLRIAIWLVQTSYSAPLANRVLNPGKRRRDIWPDSRGGSQPGARPRRPAVRGVLALL
jgi:hypothetical protein